MNFGFTLTISCCEIKQKLLQQLLQNVITFVMFTKIFMYYLLINLNFHYKQILTKKKNGKKQKNKQNKSDFPFYIQSNIIHQNNIIK